MTVENANNRLKVSVYRGGNFVNDKTFYPRFKEINGLSTFKTVEKAVAPGGKYQIIDTKKLQGTGLTAILNNKITGHVAIIPTGRYAQELSDWMIVGDSHHYIKVVRNARIDEGKRLK